MGDPITGKIFGHGNEAGDTLPRGGQVGVGPQEVLQHTQGSRHIPQQGDALGHLPGPRHLLLVAGHLGQGVRRVGQQMRPQARRRAGTQTGTEGPPQRSRQSGLGTAAVDSAAAAVTQAEDQCRQVGQNAIGRLRGQSQQPGARGDATLGEGLDRVHAPVAQGVQP